jgi:Ca2+-binding RTX toxin-like protein
MLPRPASADLFFDGSEFQVNTYTTNFQANPYGGAGHSVARGADGTFVVVWASYLADDYPHAVGQRFDSAGAALGTEFQVNGAIDPVYDVAVSSADDNSFVVVWSGANGDASYEGVRARRFDSAGAALGTEFQVNSYTLYNQEEAAVASAPDGRFVIVWGSDEDDDSSHSIKGQRFDSSGAPAGTEFKVNTYTTGEQRHAAVSSASDGSFVVVWEGFEDGDVHGQRFDSAGAAAGTEFQLNSYTTSYQANPSVASAGDGRFVVVWDSYGQDGSNLSVHGQRYDSAGAPVGTEFQVNTYTTGYQMLPAASMADDGSFAVVWQSDSQDGSGKSVHAQHYDSAGVASGTEFQVNTYTTGVQGENQSIAVDAAGNFVVVWMSDGQDGSDYGMFGQLLTQETTTTTTSTTTTTIDPEICFGQSPTAGCNVNGVDGPCVGTDGDDIIRGTDGNDVISGLGGNDRIAGNRGTDSICGGEGDDRLRNAGQGSELDGGPGNDSIRGGRRDDTILGGPGDDRLYGGHGADSIDGGADNDQAHGGKGSDTCDAEAESSCEQ